MAGPLIEGIRQMRENIQDRRAHRRGHSFQEAVGSVDFSHQSHGREALQIERHQQGRERQNPTAAQALEVTPLARSNPQRYSAEFQLSVRHGAPVQYNYTRYDARGSAINPVHPQRFEGNVSAVDDSTVARFVRKSDPRDPKHDIVTVQTLNSFKGELTLTADGRTSTLNVQNGRTNSHLTPATPAPAKKAEAAPGATPPNPAPATRQELHQGTPKEFVDSGHTLKLEIGGKSVIIPPGQAETQLEGVTITRADGRFAITVAPGHPGGSFSLTSQSNGRRLELSVPDGTNLPKSEIPLSNLTSRFPLPVSRTDALRITDSSGAVVLDVAPGGSAAAKHIAVSRDEKSGLSWISADPRNAAHGTYGVHAFRGAAHHSSGTLTIAP